MIGSIKLYVNEWDFLLKLEMGYGLYFLFLINKWSVLVVIKEEEEVFYLSDVVFFLLRRSW